LVSANLNLEGRKYREREVADNYIPTIDREPGLFT
jgi:hypothetical protein